MERFDSIFDCCPQWEGLDTDIQAEIMEDHQNQLRTLAGDYSLRHLGDLVLADDESYNASETS